MTTRTPTPTPARSEREFLRRQMNSYGSSGRFGDWLGWLVVDQPVTAAKVYRMMSDDSKRRGFLHDAELFMKAARELWPDVVSWHGRKIS